MSLHYRTIWIANTYLDTQGCKFDALRTFLDNTTSDYLYVVGDRINFAQMPLMQQQASAYTEIVRRILHKAQRGTRVMYIPSASDAAAQRQVGTTIQGVAVMSQVMHVTAEGQRQLVLHGDELGNLMQCAKQNTPNAETMVQSATALSRLFSRCGVTTPELLGPLVNNLTKSLSPARQRLASLLRDADGIICGHMHPATPCGAINGKQYTHCGDWVESCSALVETAWGKLEMIHWPEARLASVRTLSLTANTLRNAAALQEEELAWRFFSRQ